MGEDCPEKGIDPGAAAAFRFSRWSFGSHTWEYSTKKNETVYGEQVVAFLKGLRRQLGGPFTVVGERSNIHSKSQVAQAWLARHPEVVPDDFPGYAPDLNPDERVWGWTKYGRLSYLPGGHRLTAGGARGNLPPVV
jgi:hypothetical protein